MQKIIIGLIIAIFYSFNAWAWNADVTHRDLSEAAVKNSILSATNGDYLKKLGFTNNLEEEFRIDGGTPKSVSKWISDAGAVDEDSGSVFNGRFYNHFHDPTKPWSSAGLTSSLPWVKNGKSAVLWAVYEPSNEFRWKKVRDYYKAALISRSAEERSTNFAKTFKGLGHIIHLNQDMAQPAHVRNDPHPADDTGVMPGFEHWGKNHIREVNDMALNPKFPTVDTKISNNGFIPVTQFFDTDKYNGTNPSDSLSIGLSEYTQANFFSEDTLDATSFPYPNISSATTTIVTKDFTGPFGSYPRQYYLKTCCGETKDGQGYLLSTVDFLNDHRVAYNSNQPKIAVLDNNVYQDYASLLIPRAVGYSAGLLNYFFRGKMDMYVDAKSSGKYIIHNQSDEIMNGTFSLYYDDASDNRHFIASWFFIINPKEKSPPLTFTEPINPAPKENGQYILVFQGVLGKETNAVVGVSTPTINEGRILYTNGGYIFVSNENKTTPGFYLPSILSPDETFGEYPSHFVAKFDKSDWNTFVVATSKTVSTTTFGEDSWYGIYDHITTTTTTHYLHKFQIDEATFSIRYLGVFYSSGEFISTDSATHTVALFDPAITHNNVRRITTWKYAKSSKNMYLYDVYVDGEKIKFLSRMYESYYDAESTGFIEDSSANYQNPIDMYMYRSYDSNDSSWIDYGGIITNKYIDKSSYKCDTETSPDNGIQPIFEYGVTIGCTYNYFTKTGDYLEPTLILNQNDFIYSDSSSYPPYVYPGGGRVNAPYLSYFQKDGGFSFIDSGGVGTSYYLSAKTGNIVLPFQFVGENNKGFHLASDGFIYLSELIYDNVHSSYQIEDKKPFLTVRGEIRDFAMQ